MPTAYTLSVIKRQCVNTNQPSNRFVPLIYDFCKCRFPYSMLRGQDTPCDQVWHYATMICRYAIDVHANPYQMTVKTIYGYARLHATYDGDLRSSTEYERNVLIPSPMTTTVFKPYVPTVLETFKPSESMVPQILAFPMPIRFPKSITWGIWSCWTISPQSTFSATRSCW